MTAFPLTNRNRGFVMSRTCLITGGARGIGLETARLAAASGWDIAIIFREQVVAAEKAIATITSLGRKAIAIPPLQR